MHAQTGFFRFFRPKWRRDPPKYLAHPAQTCAFRKNGAKMKILKKKFFEKNFFFEIFRKKKIFFRKFLIFSIFFVFLGFFDGCAGCAWAWGTPGDHFLTILDHFLVKNGQKWAKMVENGRKWAFFVQKWIFYWFFGHFWGFYGCLWGLGWVCLGMGDPQEPFLDHFRPFFGRKWSKIVENGIFYQKWFLLLKIMRARWVF